jgi:hypothetical protein
MNAQCGTFTEAEANRRKFSPLRQAKVHNSNSGSCLASFILIPPLARYTPEHTPALTEHIVFELLFGAAGLFLLTVILLPLFGLHVSALIVLCITSFWTLVIFAAIHLIFGGPVAPYEEPERKLDPGDAEASWPREKTEILE